MNITLNGTGTTADGTVADLIAARYDARSAGIAVAVNDAVVPRHQWPSRMLTDGDTVEVVTAVQGG